jgi:hypothetical protein
VPTKTIQIRRSAEPIKIIQHHVHETRDASTQASPLARLSTHREDREHRTCVQAYAHFLVQVQSSDAGIDQGIEREAAAFVSQVYSRGTALPY